MLSRVLKSLSAGKRGPKFKVGDKCRLNDVGLKQCFGFTSGLSAMKRVVHTVTHIDQWSITEPEESYIMQVADKDLNTLLLNDNDFDPA